MKNRSIIIFDEERADEAVALLQGAGLGQVAVSAELTDDDGQQPDVVIYESLGFAVAEHEQNDGSLVALAARSESPIIDISPDLEVNLLQDDPEITGHMRSYLEGMRDTLDMLLARGAVDSDDEAVDAEWVESSRTWGLQAINTPALLPSGNGIRIAILDTGFGPHADFKGRTISGRSFIPGVTSYADDQGHGTHCMGTAAGPRLSKMAGVPRYGIAYRSSMLVGKVLNHLGSGTMSGVFAGMDWAVAQRADIISMSLGVKVAPKQTYLPTFEALAARALKKGVLIVAAAGNDSARPGLVAPVSSPANCPSIMAVGAVDKALKVAPFSNGGLNAPGGEVNIVGPGVDVLSSFPGHPGWARLSGTSMATPHVAGLAALYAAKTGYRGKKLWDILLKTAKPLGGGVKAVGKGLVYWKPSVLALDKSDE